MIKLIGVFQNKSESILFYAQGNSEKELFSITSTDGYEFNGPIQKVDVVDSEGRAEKQFSWSNFRIAKENDKYFLTYIDLSSKKPRLLGAVSEDLKTFEKTGEVDHIAETGAVVPDFKHRQLTFMMYFGQKNIKAATSSYLYQWKQIEKPVLSPRKDKFDSSDLEVANAYLLGDQILLVYYTKVNGKYAAGAALFDKNEPTEVVFRSDEPLWEQPFEFNERKLTPAGSALLENEILLYFLVDDSTIAAFPCPLPNSATFKKDFSLLIKKAAHNPILKPNPQNPWESRAAFNSAAIFEDGKVHFLYRALGDTDLSVLGYATSKDGLNIDFRSDTPAYIPREPFETPGGNRFATIAQHFMSGGGYGGIEDPRITRVDDKIYLTYVAFDGATPPRAAMSSIDVDDFLAQGWDNWSTPKLISAPNMVNKSAVVFPKKVNGKYVVMHRVYPNILIDYLDDLEFENYLEGQYFIPPRKNFWDSKKVGAGAPPMETDDGWLLIYQSVGYQDPHRYKIGAMLLDKNHPEKVLHRTSTPIIEPNEPYENDGFKAGVVYPCGAVIMNNNLHVYYGGADSVVCAATAELDKFLYEMKHDIKPKFKKVTSQKLSLN